MVLELLFQVCFNEFVEDSEEIFFVDVAIGQDRQVKVSIFARKTADIGSAFGKSELQFSFLEYLHSRKFAQNSLEVGVVLLNLLLLQDVRINRLFYRQSHQGVVQDYLPIILSNIISQQLVNFVAKLVPQNRPFFFELRHQCIHFNKKLAIEILQSLAVKHLVAPRYLILIFLIDVLHSD